MKKSGRLGQLGQLVRASLALVLASCPAPPDPPPPTPVPLLNMDDWTRVTDPSVDWFADQRPVEAICDDFGWTYDPLYMSLAIGTDICDYPTFTQPTLEPLEPGDVIDVTGLHGPLSADEPSEGYMAFAIEGEIVWEWTVPIPAFAAVIEEQFTIDKSFPVGAEMQFHLHNHGPNGWDLMEVMITHAQ